MTGGARAALVSRTEEVLSRTMEALGYPAGTQLPTEDPEDAASLIDLALELVVERLESAEGDAREAARMGRRLIALTRLQREMQACAETERLDALVNIHDGLARLGRVGSVEELAEEAAKELRASGDFDRVLLFWLDDAELRLAAVATRNASDARSVAGVVGTSAPLVAGLVEAEVVRRRVVLLASGGDARSAFPALRDDAAYVAAPIVSGGRVVGLLEADRQRTRRSLRRMDRDAVGAFAVGLGYALDRTVLAERLRAQRDEVRRLVRATDAAMGELHDGYGRLGMATSLPAAPMATTMLAPVSSTLEAVLSARETDVLEALASGATNAQIAARLYISEETVKSHVKRILRKLGASNRAEAVSRFLRLAAGPADPAK